MKKQTYLLIAAILFILVAGSYYFLKEDFNSPQPQAAIDQPTTMSYSGNTIIEEKDGKRLWELGAEKIDIDPKTKQAVIKNLKGVFYQDDGGKMELVALEAVYDTKTRDIVMQGHIKAVSDDGTVFIAQTARWAGDSQRIYGSGGVTMTKDDTVIMGDRIESDAGLQKVKVEGNARIRRGGSAN